MQTVITDTEFKETVRLLKEKYYSLSETGCFFAIVRTEYDSESNVEHDFLEVIHEADLIGYDYVTTIVFPSVDSRKVAFIDNVKYVIWLAKDHSAMKFNKDAIREKHIWKDVEWGKRVKNYHPKGKDPGNVWIPTLDDGHANITEHLLLGDEGVIRRLLSMSQCENDYELYFDPVNTADIHDHSYCSDNKRISNKGTSKIEEKVYFQSSENMAEVRFNSVKTIVTSPPYWNLKNYFKKGQIGQESYEKYLFRLETVWRECFDRLMPTGSLWININIRMHEGKVVLIPYDIVEMCKKIGYIYKGILIWHKSSGIPTGEKSIVDRHEYMLLFTKSNDFHVNYEALQQIADYKNNLINGKAFWNINRKAGSVGKKYVHPAIYPNELASRVVKISSDEGDLVLDPFLGSGTSLIAAAQNHRSCIGYEYNEGFKQLMQSRFAAEIRDVAVKFE